MSGIAAQTSAAAPESSTKEDVAQQLDVERDNEERDQRRNGVAPIGTAMERKTSDSEGASCSWRQPFMSVIPASPANDLHVRDVDQRGGCHLVRGRTLETSCRA